MDKKNRRKENDRTNDLKKSLYRKNENSDSNKEEQRLNV